MKTLVTIFLVAFVVVPVLGQEKQTPLNQPLITCPKPLGPDFSEKLRKLTSEFQTQCLKVDKMHITMNQRVREAENVLFLAMLNEKTSSSELISRRVDYYLVMAQVLDVQKLIRLSNVIRSEFLNKLPKGSSRNSEFGDWYTIAWVVAIKENSVPRPNRGLLDAVEKEINFRQKIERKKSP